MASDPVRRWLIGLAALGMLVTVGSINAAHAQETTTVKHAIGTFAVTMTPEAQAPAADGGLPASRLAIAKTFAGGLVGSAAGTMLAAGSPKPGEPAAYVAIDQFHGSVDGREGGFLLLHRGTMTRTGASELAVTIAPDTGTGALQGIAGTLTIAVKDGTHHYDLSYTLPDAR